MDQENSLAKIKSYLKQLGELSGESVDSVDYEKALRLSKKALVEVHRFAVAYDRAVTEGKQAEDSAFFGAFVLLATKLDGVARACDAILAVRK